MSHPLKRVLYPLRVALGRFAISPNNTDQLKQQLAELNTRLQEYQLSNSIIYKAAALIAAEQVEGDYLEFGVFRGYSFVTAFRSIQTAFDRASTPSIWNTDQDCIARQILWDRMRFFAFDSFQGLPQPAGLDSVSRDFVSGKFACSEQEFRQIIASSEVPLDRVTTVPGWFNESLNQETIRTHSVGKAAIVYIDCDLYESARCVLDFITDLVVDGSIIIFDDWYSFRGNPLFGEQRAFQEWALANRKFVLTQFQKEGPWKNSFIVNICNKEPGQPKEPTDA